jgi:DNA-binding beta-propeller fold protein YncE
MRLIGKNCRNSVWWTVLAVLCLAISAHADLFVASDGDASVKRYRDTGEYVEDFVASGSGGMIGNRDLTFGPDGNLYVTDPNLGEVLRFNGTNGAFMDVFADGQEWSYGLKFGPDGNLYVCSQTSGEVLRYDGVSGAPLGAFAAGPELWAPVGLEFGPDGNLYVTDNANHEVLRYDGITGAFMDSFASGSGMSSPRGLVFGPDGNLYVASSDSGQVLRYDGGSGNFMDVFASGPELAYPHMGLAFGPDGNLYVSDRENNEVLIYDGLTGIFVGVFAYDDYGLAAPTGIAFHDLTGVPDVPPLAFGRPPSVPLKIPVSALLENASGFNSATLRLTEADALSSRGATLFTNAAFILCDLPPDGNVEDGFTYRLGDGTSTADGLARIMIDPEPAGTNYNLTAYQVQDGHPVCTFAGIPGQVYDIQRAQGSAEPPAWISMATTNAPPAGRFQFTDLNPPPAPVIYRAIHH